MKKIVLTLITSGLFFAAQAQPCTPVWTGTGSGIQPDTATNLPQVVENTPYSSVINFKVPEDTTYLGFPATVDSIVINNVNGLNAIPASPVFTYAAYNNGTFPGGSEGCVLLTGTPSTGSAGTYPITVDVTIYATTSFGPVSLPQTVNGYKIVVNEFTGVDRLNVRKNGLVAYPTLVSSITELSYFTSVAEDVVITVANTMGQVVTAIKATSEAGFNQWSLDMSQLANGSYIVSLQSNGEVYTTKVMVNK